METAFNLQDTSEGTFLFQTDNMTGMVGEHMVDVKAFKCIHSSNSCVVFEKVDYHALKKAYRNIKGQYNRCEFWRAMRPLSPKGLKEESERQYNEAMSRVR